MLRKCANCYQYKDEIEFPRRTGGGHQSYCKPCKRQLDNYYKRTRREIAKNDNASSQK